MDKVIMRAKVQIMSSLSNSAGKSLLVTAQPDTGGYKPQSWTQKDDKDKNSSFQKWDMTVMFGLVDNLPWSFIYRKFTMCIDKKLYALGRAGDIPRSAVTIIPFDPNNARQSWFTSMSGDRIQQYIGVPRITDPTRPSCLEIYSDDGTKDGGRINMYEMNIPGTANQLWVIRYLEHLPGSTTPQQVAIAENLFNAAQKDPTLKASLLTDPAHLFCCSGYPLQMDQYGNFNAFLRSHKSYSQLVEALDDDRPLAESVDDWNCFLCQVGCWTIAALLVAIGAAALVFLTPEAAVVISLAAFLDTTPVVAAAFAQGLVALTDFTLISLMNHICEAVGLCQSSPSGESALFAAAEADDALSNES